MSGKTLNKANPSAYFCVCGKQRGEISVGYHMKLFDI